MRIDIENVSDNKKLTMYKDTPMEAMTAFLNYLNQKQYDPMADVRVTRNGEYLILKHNGGTWKCRNHRSKHNDQQRGKNI